MNTANISKTDFKNNLGTQEFKNLLPQLNLGVSRFKKKM